MMCVDHMTLVTRPCDGFRITKKVAGLVASLARFASVKELEQGLLGVLTVLH